MSEKKVCPICKKETAEGIVDVCQIAYEYIIHSIKEEHPEWIQENGACPKCIEYYKNL